MKQRVCAVLALIWAASLAASEPPAPNSALTTEAPLAAFGTNVTRFNVPSTIQGYLPDDKYRLRVGDRVSLQIVEDRDSPRSIVVADSGELDVPYIGRVVA